MTYHNVDRCQFNTATTGTGSVTVGTAVPKYLVPSDAGIVDGDTVHYVIEEGNDFEEGMGVYTASGTTVSRTTVIRSKIAGVVGTTKMTLAGAAVMFFTTFASDIETTFTSTTGISAAGTTSGTATALVAASDNQLWEVTTATAKQGVILPVATASFRGTVVNTTATVIFLYPPSGRSLHPFLAADIPLQIPPGGSIEVASKNTSGDHYQTNGDGWIYVYKSADTTIASNTTLASDADLTFSMVASKKYLIESVVKSLCGASNSGYKIGDAGPASPTLVQTFLRLNVAGTLTAPIGAAFGALANGAGTSLIIALETATRVVNGVNTAAYALQFAQNISTASALTVYAGSYLRYKVVP